MQFHIDPGLQFFIAFAALAFWYARWQRHRHSVKDQPLSQQREQRARQLGWRYHGTYEGDIRYRFFGTAAQGRTWELRYDSDASSSGATPKIIWEITSLAVLRKEFEISNGKAFTALGKPLVQGVTAGISLLSRVVGASPTHVIDFANEAQVQTLGSGRFRLKWKAISRSPAEVSQLIDAETEALLLNWPRAVESKFDPLREIKIVRDDKGLRIEFNYDTSDMRLFEHVVTLGVALAARLAR